MNNVTIITIVTLQRGKQFALTQQWSVNRKFSSEKNKFCENETFKRYMK